MVFTVILTTLNNTRRCFYLSKTRRCFYLSKTVNSFWPVNVLTCRFDSVRLLSALDIHMYLGKYINILTDFDTCSSRRVKGHFRFFFFKTLLLLLEEVKINAEKLHISQNYHEYNVFTENDFIVGPIINSLFIVFLFRIKLLMFQWKISSNCKLNSYKSWRA